MKGHPLQLRPDRLILLSSILIVLAFPPWDLSFLIWIALIPWFMVLNRANSYRNAFIQGLWLSFFMTLGGFYWVASVLHEFGNVPLPLSVLGLLLFGLVCQPQFLITSPLFVFFKRTGGSWLHTALRGTLFALFLGLVYVACDWMIPKLFVDTLGHSLYRAQNLRQIADFGGAHLLTFLIYLCNFSLWKFLTGVRQGSWKDALRTEAPVALLTAVLCLGGWYYGHERNKALSAVFANPTGHLQVAVIQGNIGDFDKIAAERGIRGAGEKVMSTFFDLSEEALNLTPKPDVLIWPETAYPSTFRTPQTTEEFARDRQVESFVRKRGIPLLFGGYDHSFNKDYNSFFFLTPLPQTGAGTLASLEQHELDLQIYHKNILLLFGEYIPGAERIRFLRDLFPQVGNFGRGEGPITLKIRSRNSKLQTVLAGPVICYEALFPNYVIEAARRGSQMILNITNDSWFGPFGEPQLHLALVTFRSIETRLPQLRATNTGISALILPNGEIAQRTSIGQPEVMNARVPIISPVPTVLKKWGDWFGSFAFFCGIIGTAGLGLSARSRAASQSQRSAGSGKSRRFSHKRS